MPTIPQRRVGAAAAFVAAVVGLTGAIAPAHAAEGSPPVTVDDSVTLTAGGLVEADLLRNDSDPDGDPLAVCRVDGVPRNLEVFGGMRDGEPVEVIALEPGTYSFTYYACDRDYLTPATVTVTVKPAPRLRLVVKKLARPGKAKVVNRGDLGFQFLWGSWKRRKEDGSVRVRPHTAKVVSVRRPSIIWIAVNFRRGAFRSGVVRGIELPKGAVALPPGAPSRDADLGLSLRASRWRG